MGVGTVNPGSNKLNVQRSSGNNSNADIRATDGTQWIDFNSNQAVGSWNSLVRNNDASIIYSAGTIDNTNSAIVIGPHSASSKGIRINSSGNVGIGITTPNAALTVNGVISATNRITSNTSVYGTSPNSGVTGGVIVKDAPSNPNVAYLQFVNNAASTSYGYVQGLSAGGVSIGGGNVGVGTTSPTKTLTVTGDVSATGKYYFTDGSSLSSSPVGSPEQSWQNVTSLRTQGSTYTNSTGRPIQVSIYGVQLSTNQILFYINSVQVSSTVYVNNIASGWLIANHIIPVNSTYKLSTGQQGITWWELR